MKKILVLGGTRFFGKRMVEKLLEQGHEVTIATRGLTEDEFGDQVQRLIIDRADAEQLRSTLGRRTYDVVYDQIGYSPNDAQVAVEVFAGRTSHYVFTSSMAVYDGNEEPWTEAGFDPDTYPNQLGGREDFDYKEGKRIAEAIFFQKANFPVTAVRFPVVLGEEDYTRRIEFHLDRIRDGIAIGFENLEAKTCLIDSEEAADFLCWLAEHPLEGPVNACANGVIRWRELFDLMEQVVGKEAKIVPKTDAAHTSPYDQATSRYLDSNKASQAGFAFGNLSDWLPKLLQRLGEQA